MIVLWIYLIGVLLMYMGICLKSNWDYIGECLKIRHVFRVRYDYWGSNVYDHPGTVWLTSLLWFITSWVILCVYIVEHNVFSKLYNKIYESKGKVDTFLRDVHNWIDKISDINIFCWGDKDEKA